MEWLTGLGPVFLAGLAAGLTVAMPFGPFGQLAARLTAEKKRRDARELAYTAIAVDAVLSALVLMFLYVLPVHVRFNHPVLMVVLGIVLCGLGLELLRTAKNCPAGHLPGGFKRPWQFAAVYAVVHPGSFLMFMGAFGVMHANGVFDNPTLPWGARLVCWLGVVLGMFIMWVIWFGLVHHLKRRMAHTTMRLVFARGLALTLLVSGVVLLWKSGVLQGLIE